MNLQLNKTLGAGYKSKPQQIRVITENWVENNLFCPQCGNLKINSYENNRKVADFFCERCGWEYELKSKNGEAKDKIVDGQYDTMIERLNSLTNPSLFFLNYDKDYVVNDFLAIPKYFFVPEIIEKRKPLSLTARRAGWTGCNILFSKIPSVGVISIIKNKRLESVEKINQQWQKTQFLNEAKTIDSRGWTLDIFTIITNLNKIEFTLDDVYQFEFELSKKHPENNHITDKIRQQLQVLRDKNVLEFVGRGKYKILI